jgi:hypothetical protein
MDKKMKTMIREIGEDAARIRERKQLAAMKEEKGELRKELAAMSEGWEEEKKHRRQKRQIG